MTAEKILSIFFPLKCAGCKTLVIDKIICPNCLPQIEKCRINNQQSKQILRNIDSLTFPYFYGGVIVPVIFALKKGNNRHVFDFFADETAKNIQNNGIFSAVKFSLITNVPRKGSSSREYGYDQSAKLAKKISERLKIPYAATLRQKGGGEEQKMLNYEERIENVKDKFVFKASSLSGNILLIDDVFTSGATAEECARVLKENGAEKVYAATAAGTRYGG